jgi:hypothetical protein
MDYERVCERADAAIWSVAQTHLSEFEAGRERRPGGER